MFDVAKRPFTIQLIIIRAVAFDAPFCDELYSWLNCVVDTACDERRNQRVWVIYFTVLCSLLIIC